MKIPAAEAVFEAMRERGYVVFNGRDPRGGQWREPDLNLVGLRAVPGSLDTFDDLICAIWQPAPLGAGALPPLEIRVWAATLDPGKPGLEHPTRQDGTAQMALGQTRGAFRRGWHHPGTADAYRCLTPAVPIPVVRYHSVAAFEAGRGSPSTSDATQIHHASASHPSTIVGAWSLGCAVTAEAASLAELMALCDLQAAAGLGETLTWTVLPWPSA